MNAVRTINYLIKILFYLEKRYIPYCKWIGIAFKQLNSYTDFEPLIIKLLQENNSVEIEKNLCILYEKVIQKHNENKELPFLNNKTRDFFNRPYKVIFFFIFVDELKKSIEDEEVKGVNITKYGYDLILDF
jgi:hypothetical protein